MRSWPLPFLLLLSAHFACGGPPLKTKDEASAAVAHSALPSRFAKGQFLGLFGSAGVPTPSIEVPGPKGGSAVLMINPVGAAVGAAAQGVLFDVEYKGFTADGKHVFDGLLSANANFAYVAPAGEDPSADLSLKLIGRVALSGAYSDDLDVNLTLTAQFDDLSFRDESVHLRLNGRLDTPGESFEFANEDIEAVWEGR